MAGHADDPARKFVARVRHVERHTREHRDITERDAKNSVDGRVVDSERRPYFLHPQHGALEEGGYGGGCVGECRGQALDEGRGRGWRDARCGSDCRD